MTDPENDPPFLDTNILLRHVLQDHPKQSAAASALVQSISAGRVRGWTTALAIAEVVFVLSNRTFYTFTRAEVRDLLLPVIDLPSLALSDKEIFSRVFDLYVALPVDFVDAYHAAMVECRSPPELYSYDRDFDRIPTVTRLEP